MYSQDDDGYFTDRILLYYIERNEMSLKVRIEDGVVWFDYTKRKPGNYTITFDVYAF